MEGFSNQVILTAIPLPELIEQLKVVLKDHQLQIPGTNQVIDENLISTKELCVKLDVSEPTVQRYREKGKIPYYQMGTNIRFKLSEVLNALLIDKK